MSLREEIEKRADSPRYEGRHAHIRFELNHLELHDLDGYLLACFKRGIKEDLNPNNSSIKYLLEMTDDIQDGPVATQGGSWPDIDVDFEHTKRHLVKEHLREVYGDDHVANIGTVTFSKAKGVFKDVARIYGLDFGKSNSISKLFPDMCSSIQEALEGSPELIALIAKDREVSEVFDYAEHLEGSVRAMGIHAAGVVISPEPVTDLVPLFESKGESVTMFDGPTLEKIGLIKYDLLGLKALSVIGLTLQMVKDRHGIDIDINAIPEDDPGVYQLIADNKTLGVFQIEGSTFLMDFAAASKPDNIGDISAIISLTRPGPMGLGAPDEYIARRNGETEPVFEIPEYNYIFSDTSGLLVYQEQIMRLAGDMCGFDDIKRDFLRKATAKKDIVLLKSLKRDFVDGAVKHGGQERATISDLFDRMEEFARYSFNKCLVGETMLRLVGGGTMDIDSLIFTLKSSEEVMLLAYDPKEKKVFQDACVEVVDAGIQQVYDVTFSGGHTERCSSLHKFLCADGRMHSIVDILTYGYSMVSLDKSGNVEFSFMSKIYGAGEHQVYNLTMKSETHNYILDSGLVSANSHAVAYAYITYQTAWLKCNYPSEYLSAAITCEPETDQQSIYMADARRMGIQVLPPDLNQSQRNFVVGSSGEILFGFSAIKGLGDRVLDKLLSLQPFSSFSDFLMRAYQAKGINKKVIDALICSGACDTFGYKRSCLLSGFESFIIDYATASTTEYDPIISAGFTSKESEYFEDPLAAEFPILKILDMEFDLLGVHISGNPFTVIKSLVTETVTSIDEFSSMSFGAGYCLCQLVAIKKIVTKKGDPMAFLDVLDEDGDAASMTVFPNVYPKIANILTEGKYVLLFVTAKTEKRGKGLFVMSGQDLTAAVDKMSTRVEESKNIKNLHLYVSETSTVRMKSIEKKIAVFEVDKKTAFTCSVFTQVDNLLFLIKQFHVNKIDIPLIREFSKLHGVAVSRAV